MLIRKMFHICHCSHMAWFTIQWFNSHSNVEKQGIQRGQILKTRLLYNDPDLGTLIRDGGEALEIYLVATVNGISWLYGKEDCRERMNWWTAYDREACVYPGLMHICACLKTTSEQCETGKNSFLWISLSVYFNHPKGRKIEICVSHPYFLVREKIH